MKKLLALLERDARTVYRDRFLLFVLFYGLVIALVTRILVELVDVPGLPLYLAPAVVLVGGMLVGTVSGFNLIDERETKTSLLLRVLPISRGLELLYFFASTTGLSLAISLAGVAIYGRAVTEWGSFALLCLGGALTGPLLALLLGATAENKVTGLAVGKIASAVAFLPVLVLVVPHPWQLLLAWNPWYWLYLGLVLAYGPPSEAQMLAILWPPLPSWTYWAVPLVLVLVASGALERRRRQSVV